MADFKKVPFEVIALEEAKIFSSTKNVDTAMDLLISFVKSCGWEMKEYEDEVSRRIDE
jgi:hypothetical protein